MGKGTSILHEQTHPIERILLDSRIRKVLGWMARRNGSSLTLFEKMMLSFDNPQAPLLDRLRFYPLHAFFEDLIDRHQVNEEMLKFKLFRHRPTLRAIVNTSRSIQRFGLTTPQRFDMPLMVVWNFTQACNLRCVHCYQEAGAHPLTDEMSLEDKLRLVDEMGDNYVPFLALAGGEPLMGGHFWEVLRRCQQRGIHVTIASNGTTLKGDVPARLVDHGVKYVEVSIDSARPDVHDRFRGITGSWQRTIDGIKAGIATPGLRVGMATCVTRLNVDEVEDIIRLAIDLGCSTFVHFNYIPVGRGIKNDLHDLSPEQRESLLRTLTEWMQTRKISIMSTAPQLGRACFTYVDVSGRMAVGHAGSGPGEQGRVLAKYVGGCGAARCYCSVQPNGDVTPCVYIPHRIIGNVTKGSLRQIWEENEYSPMLTDRDHLGDSCRTCDFRSVCGGCRARADAYTGDILAGDPGCVCNSRLWQDLNPDGVVEQVE